MTKYLQRGPQPPGWNLNMRPKSLSLSLIALRVVLVCSYRPDCCSWVCVVFVATSVIKTLRMRINFLCSIYYNITTPLTCEPCGKHTGGQPALPTAPVSRSIPSIEHLQETLSLALLGRCSTGLPASAPADHWAEGSSSTFSSSGGSWGCPHAVDVLIPGLSCLTFQWSYSCWSKNTDFFLLHFKQKFSRNCPNSITWITEASFTQENYTHARVMKFIFTSKPLLQQIPTWTELHCSEDAIPRSHIFVSVQEWARWSRECVLHPECPARKRYKRLGQAV